jgi:hypothetical protein
MRNQKEKKREREREKRIKELYIKYINWPRSIRIQLVQAAAVVPPRQRYKQKSNRTEKTEKKRDRESNKRW